MVWGRWSVAHHPVKVGDQQDGHDECQEHHQQTQVDVGHHLVPVSQLVLGEEVCVCVCVCETLVNRSHVDGQDSQESLCQLV